MKLWPVAVILFLIIGGYVIVKTDDLDLKEGEGRTEFVFKFARWVFHLGKNIKDITGHIIDQEWLPEGSEIINQTNHS
ncbi:hypothetical protein HN592_04735 [Candidatus Woesearchaeota archaeon]|nr:hypothetical protein [Candidatus Woesearchaeota archaeon]MBT4368519.1 hypothetical protein [Candidatus Woesearchaeota archaeon]MBT4713008.1 hypothetical protein [Candidatus Woesearchaeota archaeon]MBT6639920.1 hypothetical protein [Candidatus Woesearchaeota archaeon]MBT7134092.1 hypothetical protein [Candidatus Woesearchaeota archaeon]